MKRGEIWTGGGGKNYGAKPRPVVILQEDGFDDLDSLTICPLTTDDTDLPLFRISVKPDGQNGLLSLSRLMADKINTLPKAKMGRCIGRLGDADMLRLNRAVILFLGLADASMRQGR
jgi:mRNA interferase MazF